MVADTFFSGSVNIERNSQQMSNVKEIRGRQDPVTLLCLFNSHLLDVTQPNYRAIIETKMSLVQDS